MKQTEYLIIGAGIVGCSAAYLLTKDGKKVTVVDKSYPCNEASGVNAGGMELLQQPPKSLPMHILAAELWDMFQNQDGIDCGYHRTGGLYCVLREEDLPMLDAQAKTFKKHNLPIERLNKEQVKEKMVCIPSSRQLKKYKIFVLPGVYRATFLCRQSLLFMKFHWC